MSNEYIADGEVARDKIALDIKYRKLNRSDIERIANDPKIKASFIGSGYSDKRPKSEWDKSYLDCLSYVVIAGSFNRDYLLYLDEVADFVSKAKSKKVMLKNALISGIGIVFVIISVIVVCNHG